MREICSSGTVRGGDGNVPTYSAGLRSDQRRTQSWTSTFPTMVKKWAKDGTIPRLEQQYHIKASQFAADMHKKYTGQ